MSTPYLRKRRDNLWKEKNGKCFWCNCDTVLPNQCDKKKPPLHMATIDHLRTRFMTSRKDPIAPDEYRVVLSCLKCNRLRGVLYVKAHEGLKIQTQNGLCRLMKYEDNSNGSVP